MHSCTVLCASTRFWLEAGGRAKSTRSGAHQGLCPFIAFFAMSGRLVISNSFYVQLRASVRRVFLPRLKYSSGIYWLSSAWTHAASTQQDRLSIGHSRHLR